MKKFLFLLLLFPVIGTSQNTLNITIEGVKTSNGNVSVAVYNQENGFLKFDKAYKSDSTLAKKGKTKIRIEDLPEGEYALAIFHDANNNHILDVNWLGIPKEAIGFSKAKMKAFGPPTYGECTFKITSDHNINVVL